MTEKKIGVITQYFQNISVAAIKLDDELKVGDKIKIKGATTDFQQDIKSMELNRESIEKASPGQEIAIKVKDRVRENDEVFVIT